MICLAPLKCLVILYGLRQAKIGKKYDLGEREMKYKSRGVVAAFFFAICCSSSVPSSAATTEKLEQRILSLEEQIEPLEVEAEVAGILAEDLEERFEAAIQISGYMDAEFIATDFDGDVSRFRIHHFSLFFKKQVSEKWQIFSEIEYEDGPEYEATSPDNIETAKGKIFLEQVYTDYAPTAQTNLRIGRFLTPTGIWSVNHYPPFVPTQSRPQYLEKIFPLTTDGIQLSGALNTGDNNLAYFLYAGNGEGNTGKGDANEEKAYGVRAEWQILSLRDLKFGVSYYQDVMNDATEKIAYGGDIQFSIGPFRVQAEYAVGDYIHHATDDDHIEHGYEEGEEHKATGYYAQIQYDIDQWTFVYRYDYYESTHDLGVSSIRVNVGGINYHWTPTIVTKVEVNSYEYPNSAGEELGDHIHDGGAASKHLHWIVSSVVSF